jgi:2-polyprenyl-3-methyl-5-hydroxy-6-metoxy-1,4-benzoquinol methylase
MDECAEQYLQWKGWEANEFGLFDALLARYFEAETALSSCAGLRVLELGFGNGSFLGWARSKGAEVYGIETNPALVTRANAVFGRSSAFGSLEDLTASLPALQFHLVAGFDVLEHVAQDSLVPLLAGLGKRLVDGGRIVVRFPNGDSPFGRVTQHGDPTHVNTIGSSKLRFAAGEAGLTVRALRAPQQPIRGVGLRRGLRRAALLSARSIAERIIGQLYFSGQRIPLDPNYTAILTRSR